MDCSLGKKFASVEGCFLEPLNMSVFTVMGGYLLISVGLRCDIFFLTKHPSSLCVWVRVQSDYHSMEIWTLILSALWKLERFFQLL